MSYYSILNSTEGKQSALNSSSNGFHIEYGNITKANTLIQFIVLKEMNENEIS